MLTKPILFAVTANAQASRQFYEYTLGLKFVSDHPYAIVFDVEGITLRVQKVEQVVAVPYTSLGFEVDDIETTVQDLTGRQVVFEQYPFLQQDAAGIWTTPDGAKVAWFKDPDGNTLSLSEHP